MKEALIILAILLVSIQSSLNHKEHMEAHQKTDSLLMRRTHIDSLYWGHLEQCSYINKFQIEVGYDNYLRLKK